MEPRRLVLVGLASVALALVVVPGGPLTWARDGGARDLSPPRVTEPGTSSGCLVCHGSPAIRARRPGPEGARLHVSTATLARSVHASLSCTSCHEPLPALITAHPRIELKAGRTSCGRCHREQAAEYAGSIHSTSRLPEADREIPLPSEAMPRLLLPNEEEEPIPALRPNCVTCHGAHDVPPAASRSFQDADARRCSRCHVEQGGSFFDRNYHGKETALGRRDVAVCADCHGVHLVLPADDPRSPVNRANLLDTCRRCHRGAPSNFADIKIHVAGSPLPADPRLLAVTLLMTLLVVGVFAFFGGHTAMSIWHAWREGRQRRERQQ